MQNIPNIKFKRIYGSILHSKGDGRKMSAAESNLSNHNVFF